MKHHVLTESIELHPIGSCFSDNVGNSELREILCEYFGKNEISYTADYSKEITCCSASTCAFTPNGIIHLGVACPILILYNIGSSGLLITFTSRSQYSVE